MFPGKIPSKLFVFMQFTWQFYSLTFEGSPDLIKFQATELNDQLV